MLHDNPFSDIYFSKGRRALQAAGRNPRVMYQIFQRNSAVLCGMKYVLELFRTHLAQDLAQIEVWGLEDGSQISSEETIALLMGPAQILMEFETIYLGLLARMTRVATNVRKVVDAARGKPVLFFPARFDAYENQPYDGYAAKIGGVAGCSTKAQAHDDEPAGTMPHALIAAFNGDMVAATFALLKAYPDDPVWPLVDFENNSARTAVEVFLALKERRLESRMAGIRLDTSSDVFDEGLAAVSDLRGVNPALVQQVRAELDRAGAKAVKICVSGGFDQSKVARFETENAPVDVYAVGEKMFAGSNPFTSDIVGYYEGQNLVPSAKVGRCMRPNPDRLKRLI